MPEKQWIISLIWRKYLQKGQKDYPSFLRDMVWYLGDRQRKNRGMMNRKYTRFIIPLIFLIGTQISLIATWSYLLADPPPSDAPVPCVSRRPEE